MEEKVELVQAVGTSWTCQVISRCRLQRLPRHRTHRAHGEQMDGGGDRCGARGRAILLPSLQEGVHRRHYKAVNDSADKPIIVYDVPGRTGLHIS